MRILRSQYLQYQKSVTKTSTLTAYKKLNDDGAIHHKTAATTKTIAKVATSGSGVALTGQRRQSILLTPATNAVGGGGVQLLGQQRRHSIFLPATNICATPPIRSTGDSNQQSVLTVHPQGGPDAHAQLRQQPNLQLIFHSDIATTTRHINVVLHFYDEETKYFTQIYRSYENLVWRRLPRGGEKKYLRWYFQCRICDRNMCSFGTLKGHLNNHMQFYPHRCDQCPKKYTSRSSLTKHTRKIHVIRALVAPQIY